MSLLDGVTVYGVMEYAGLDQNWLSDRILSFPTSSVSGVRTSLQRYFSAAEKANRSVVLEEKGFLFGKWMRIMSAFFYALGKVFWRRTALRCC